MLQATANSMPYLSTAVTDKRLGVAIGEGATYGSWQDREPVDPSFILFKLS